MSVGRGIASFLRAPGRRQALALEAAGELARARLITLLPARIYTRDFGSMNAAPDAAAAAACPEAASEIGRMVEAVARAMPFRALCLQQAVAARRMLRRRGVRATVYLGVKHNAADPNAPARKPSPMRSIPRRGYARPAAPRSATRFDTVQA